MSAQDNKDALEAAASAGLSKMAEQFPDDVARAFDFAKSLTERLPRDIAPADEPAHVYRARSAGE